jgi:hypothetical protein
MNRTRSILAAGTFTGLVLITILALGFSNSQAKSAEDAAAAPSSARISLPQTNSMSDEEALQAWQAYSAELEQTVHTLQDRDTAYQQQLDAANQTILQLQDQINSSNSAPTYYDDDEYEHEEHEHEEGEHEFGERFD